MRLADRMQDPFVDAVVGFTVLLSIGGVVLFGERLGWPDHVLGLVLGGLFLLLLGATVLAFVGARRRTRAWDARMRGLGFTPLPGVRRFHAFARYKGYGLERPDGTAVAVLLLPDERDRLALAVRTPWGDVFEDEVAPTDDAGLLRHLDVLAERAARAAPGEAVSAQEAPEPEGGLTKLDIAKAVVGVLGFVALVGYWSLRLLGIVDEAMLERHFPLAMGAGLAMAGAWVVLTWLDRRRGGGRTES